MRFPWNIVEGWDVSSLASGNVLIQVRYIDGKIPGVFTRMRLALWVSDRLVKRSKRATNEAPAATAGSTMQSPRETGVTP